MATKNKSTDTIKSAIGFLDCLLNKTDGLIAADIAHTKRMLETLVKPAAPKARGIESITLLLSDGIHRRFNPNDAKSAAAAETTLCILCKAPLKFARISGWGGKSCPGIPAGPTHAGCTAKARADVDRIFAELDANRVQIQFDAEAAKHCACTHHAIDHTPDEMENLLTCTVKGCDCDHFRSAIPAADTTWVEVEIDGTVYDGDMIDANEMEMQSAAAN